MLLLDEKNNWCFSFADKFMLSRCFYFLKTVFKKKGPYVPRTSKTACTLGLPTCFYQRLPYFILHIQDVFNSHFFPDIIYHQVSFLGTPQQVPSPY